MGFILRARDQLKIEIMFKVSKGEIRTSDACSILKVSERTLRRYLKSFREKGIYFIKHGNCGKTPRNKIPEPIKLHTQALIKQRYFDFNMSHLREKLIEEFNITIKYETLRKWCHEIGYVKHAQKRRYKPKYYRQRMSQKGLLLQMDGSHHKWFSDRTTCLMAVIDDATNEVYARFYDGETTVACMDFLKRHIEKYGVCTSYYTDKAGLFGGIKRSNFSQVERALGEVGSQVIYAHTPEAKGRVERLFKTLQDRLIPELRLKGITTMKEANYYLETTYLPYQHNQKYMVKAHNPLSAYRSLAGKIDLNDVFCLKEFRVVARDHTVSINGVRYFIADELRHSINKQKLEIRFNKWGDFKAYFANKDIKLVRIIKAQKITA